MPHLATALRNTCVLKTPSPLLDEAFRYAKDNLARCMRWYSLGWGMSNCPHASTIVVGRDTGWMCFGTDYVAPWFAPEALRVFRDRQKSNGQILEYVEMETGKEEDYGLNVADNTPFYVWAVWHHWRMTADEAFRETLLPSVERAAEHLLRERGASGLLVGVPAGKEVFGSTTWRNIIPNNVHAGEVTEINALSALALRQAAELTGNSRYETAADDLTEAINRHLWTGEGYLLYRMDGVENRQVTGDMLFPVLCGVAPPERARIVLERLGQPDFWSERGMRTVPTSDPLYSPSEAVGLLGGSWPNLTLWYAAAVARFDPNRALAALETVARPVVEAQSAEVNVRQGEFAEYFDGATGVNRGMHLSPWVAPTFLWAVLEGLLGLTWEGGEPRFAPHFPADWQEVRLSAFRMATGAKEIVLSRPPDAV